MNNKFQDSTRWRSYAKEGTFDPGKAPDIASTMEREYNKYLNRLQPYERSLEQRKKAEIENAGKKAETDAAVFKELGALSKTALDMWKGIEEQSQKDIEIGETYDALFGDIEPDDPQSQQDAEDVAVGEAQGPIIAGMAIKAEEATGNPESAEVVRRNLGGLAEGVAGEKGLLIQAQTQYGGWMTDYLMSDNTITVDGVTMPVRVAAQSPDGRLRQMAITSGRREFIRSHGLQNATKANVVKYLANTVIQVDAQMGSALARSTIQEARDAEIKEIEGITYSAARNGSPSTAQDTYNQMSEQMYVRNTGLTRGAASDKAITQMIQGAVASGNVDYLEALRDVKRVPGQAGTELWRTHGAEIDKAIKQAQQQNNQNSAATIKEIEAGMYQALNGVQDAQQRGVIVEDAALRLEAAGEYKKARELRLQQAALSTPGGTQFNEAEAEQGILNGEITTIDEINNLRAQNLITATGHKNLVDLLTRTQDAKPPKESGIKEITGAYFDRWETTFEPAMGLARNPVTGTITPGKRALISPGEAAIINQSVEAELNRVANIAYRNHADLDPGKREIKVREALQTWWQENVLDSSGKYYMGNLKGYDADGRDEAVSYWTGLANNPTALATFNPGQRTAQEIGPRDLTQYVNPGVPPSTQTQQRFNPLRGDQVFTQQEVVSYYEQMSEGEVPKGLAVVAQGLGMTPLGLLNNQINAYPNSGLRPISPLSQRRSSNATTDKEITSGLAAAQYLITLDLPPRSAAMLAGNVQAESAMDGQRPYWVLDDGAGQNGGLLSWNRGRLQAVESHFGKPIQQVTNAEQLSYMVTEMRRDYPEVWRVFKNPYSTERQLRTAIYRYIGWGIEGDRFAIATQIYSQLTQ